LIQLSWITIASGALLVMAILGSHRLKVAMTCLPATGLRRKIWVWLEQWAPVDFSIDFSPARINENNSNSPPLDPSTKQISHITQRLFSDAFWGKFSWDVEALDVSDYLKPGVIPIFLLMTTSTVCRTSVVGKTNWCRFFVWSESYHAFSPRSEFFSRSVDQIWCLQHSLYMLQGVPWFDGFFVQAGFFLCKAIFLFVELPELCNLCPLKENTKSLLSRTILVFPKARHSRSTCRISSLATVSETTFYSGCRVYYCKLFAPFASEYRLSV
jgi:hypothetical protein